MLCVSKGRCLNRNLVCRSNPQIENFFDGGLPIMEDCCDVKVVILQAVRTSGGTESYLCDKCACLY